MTFAVIIIYKFVFKLTPEKKESVYFLCVSLSILLKFLLVYSGSLSEFPNPSNTFDVFWLTISSCLCTILGTVRLCLSIAPKMIRLCSVLSRSSKDYLIFRMERITKDRMVRVARMRVMMAKMQKRPILILEEVYYISITLIFMESYTKVITIRAVFQKDMFFKVYSYRNSLSS